MSNRGVRNLFVFGSLFFFIIFVGMTYDTMKRHDERVPPITEEVNQGKMLWHKYDCIGCHTIFGNGSYFAPDLTKITRDKPKGYVSKFLVDPKGVNEGAVMPDLGITPDEADLIVAFLEWTSGVDTNGWPPEPVLAGLIRQQSHGAGAYQRNNCSACHMIAGVGGTSGPDLTHIGTRRPDPEWHMRHFKDPASVVEGSAMPSYTHLGEEELRELTDYMLALR